MLKVECLETEHLLTLTVSLRAYPMIQRTCASVKETDFAFMFCCWHNKRVQTTFILELVIIYIQTILTHEQVVKIIFLNPHMMISSHKQYINI